jgi:hypothetical protein
MTGFSQLSTCMCWTTRLLELGFGSVVKWKLPALKILGSAGAAQWVGWGPEMASGAGHLLPPGVGQYCNDRYLHKFENYVEK